MKTIFTKNKKRKVNMIFLEEDRIFSEIADKRFQEAKKGDFISEEDFWEQAL